LARHALFAQGWGHLADRDADRHVTWASSAAEAT